MRVTWITGVAFVSLAAIACGGEIEDEEEILESAVGSGADPCPSYGELTIGCRDVTADDGDLVAEWKAPPMYALGDINGNGFVDRDDVARLKRKVVRNQDIGPCARAGDLDFDNVLTTRDLSVLDEIKGTPELRLFHSAHMSCNALQEIGSRSDGAPGSWVPLVFYGDLRVQPTQIVVNGPATLQPVDLAHQTYVLLIDEDAIPDSVVEARIYIGATPADFEARRSRARNGRVFIHELLVAAATN